jgi:hypothetical protein
MDKLKRAAVAVKVLVAALQKLDKGFQEYQRSLPKAHPSPLSGEKPRINKALLKLVKS